MERFVLKNKWFSLTTQARLMRIQLLFPDSVFLTFQQISVSAEFCNNDSADSSFSFFSTFSTGFWLLFAVVVVVVVAVFVVGSVTASGMRCVVVLLLLFGRREPEGSMFV